MGFFEGAADFIASFFVEDAAAGAAAAGATDAAATGAAAAGAADAAATGAGLDAGLLGSLGTVGSLTVPEAAGAATALGGAGALASDLGGASTGASLAAEGIPGAAADTAAGLSPDLVIGPAATAADFTAPLSGAALGSDALTGVADTGSAAGGVAPAASGTAPAVTAAPGITTGPSGLAANATALGAPTAATPGPGVAAFAPPASVAPGALDPTAALAQSQGGGLFTGAAESAPATSTESVLAQGAAGTLPGQTATAGAAQPTVDALTGVGALPGGAPTAPPFLGSFGADVSNFFSPVTNLVDSAGSALNSPTGKLLSTAVGVGGLAKNLVGGAGTIKGESQLESLASQLGATGASLIAPNATAAENVAGQATAQATTLENYLTTGSLPPAVQAALDQATSSAITDAKAAAGAKGESADPNQNSALAQTIAAIHQNAIINGGSLAASLYSQGVNLDQLASQIYTGLVGQGTSAAGTGVAAQENVVQTNAGLNTNLNNSIANLASALGGGSHVIVNGNTVAVPA